MNLGENIKAARKKTGISQKELSEKLNIPKSTLCGYENNHRKAPISVLLKISELLNTSIAELTGSEVKTYTTDNNGELIETNDLEKSNAAAIFTFNEKNGKRLNLPYSKENYLIDPVKYFEDLFILYAKEINNEVIYKSIYEIDDLKVLNRILNTTKEKINFLKNDIEL